MDGIVNEGVSAAEDQNGESQPSLREITAFGTNPGNLRMHLFEPPGARGLPLVVALHGCTQTAAGFAEGSGWLRLAEEENFMVVLPEQRSANNRHGCFNWFEPDDIRRGSGEAESIHQMIEEAVRSHGADADRVFICGLSAGGAMACAMLATYPDVFVGGAIIAGLPYGAASNAAEALDTMYSGRIKEAKAWGDLVRSAAEYAERLPRVSIWHGTSDKVVKPINAGELIKQWTNVHGVGAESPTEDHVDVATRRIWRDARKAPVVTEYSVAGLAHGAPVAHSGQPSPFFLPIGLSSTWHIADDWGLVRRRRDASWLARLGLG